MADPLQGEVYHWPQIKKNHPTGSETIHKWVIVSRDAFNESSSHVLGCPLTSYPATAIDIEVKATPHNKLDHDSSLLARMITPILKKELGQPVSRLPTSVTGQVLDRIRLLIEVD
ncbi:MAG: type II toxin-antitoxin system PemK/MazF family toxin [Planctomycetota bacterium]|nr:MAG: type II toxin-antitoxin system PemK/MazF family toxin [Planctomycetota bacterium]